MASIPSWATDLDHEDWVFIKKFILASGSLKEVAEAYGVTYPTVRLRLDRLIQKIRISDTEEDSFVGFIKRLALQDELHFDTAKKLITHYKKQKGDS